jgi:hypothetical protein
MRPGGGGPTPLPAADPATAYCEALQECEPGAVRESFGSVSDCADSLEEFREYYAADYGRACAQAFDRAMECMTDVLQETCRSYADYDECEKELRDFSDECGYYDYYYDY